jgi:hypothetical protein
MNSVLHPAEGHTQLIDVSSTKLISIDMCLLVYITGIFIDIKVDSIECFTVV